MAPLEAQARALRKQNFEATFIQMIGVQRDITNSIKIVDSNRDITHSGHDALQYYVHWFTNQLQKIHASNREPMQAEVTKIWLSLEQRYTDVVPYCRNLEALIQFLHDADVPDGSLYMTIVKAQLTAAEIVILYYAAIAHIQDWRLAAFLMEADFFEQLSVVRLAAPEHKDLLAKIMS